MNLKNELYDAWKLDEQAKRQLLPIEQVTIAYTLLTLVLILIFWGDMFHPGTLLLQRILILSGIGAFYLLHRRLPSEGTRFLRNLFPLTLLGFWYPDTFEFCQLFSNKDFLFADADNALFDCQPSLEFPHMLDSKAWSELFHMGYFSYYPMIAVTIVAPLFRSRRLFEKTAFIVMASFFLYYGIYLFLPVAGPQFYFQAVGADQVAAGHFPMLGDYFRTHTELINTGGHEGFFRSLVEFTQEGGERPTAAFPSSHVGISTILMVLLYRHNRRIFYTFIPFFVLLCCSTVYIQAHYLVDVFGGFASAALFYPFTRWLYSQLHVKSYHNHGHNHRRHHRNYPPPMVEKILHLYSRDNAMNDA